MSKNIAVIGQGFVGGSLTTVFAEQGFVVHTFDKTGKKAVGASETQVASIAELIQTVEPSDSFSKIYFVCVPTPMFEDGTADLSVVEGVLEELSLQHGERIAVVKSTVPPGSVERWNEKFSHSGLRVIFSPEFLTERTAVEDMRNQNRIILGGPRPWINTVKQIFRVAFPNVTIIKTSSTTAEMIKYLTNNFLTVKVAFANEMAQICEALDASGLNIDYDKVIEYASYDERVGKSHWNVPGPDGKRGYGGHCFPKDINAMIDVACKNGVDPKILKAAWQKNLEIRPEKDWESLTGRAVSTKTKT